jgi:DNA-binding HxlR family transcriptional regulator
MSGSEISHQCKVINAVLARVGDRWSVQIIFALGDGAKRFNVLKRDLGITQRVLAKTLRDLQSDGLVSRLESTDILPKVEYELTDLGRSFRSPVLALAEWAIQNQQVICVQATAKAVSTTDMLLVGDA